MQHESDSPSKVLTGGTLVLPDQLVDVDLLLTGSLIAATLPRGSSVPEGTQLIDVSGHFVTPGYIDIHVHGGAGGDFMDGTAESFDLALRSHLRHGTTGILPTTTVARHDQILTTLTRIRDAKLSPTPGHPRVLGAHFYGPYFNEAARGCHPAESVRPPAPSEYREYLEFSDTIRTATIAPEVDGTKEFAQACRERDIHVNVGHSHATFDQMVSAIEWGGAPRRSPFLRNVR